MSESQAPEVPGRRNPEHELWLAMQAAYNKYRNASSALDAGAAQPQGSMPSAEQGGSRVETAASEQRTAFQNYIEARMQFAEFRCDQNIAGPRGVTDPSHPGRSTQPEEEKSTSAAAAGFGVSRLALSAAVGALLCTAALSLVYVVRERGHGRDADATRDEISATLMQARAEIHSLVRKLDAVNVTQQFAIRESDSVPTPPVRPRRTPVTNAAGRKPAGEGGWRHFQTLPPRQKQSHVPKSHDQLVHQVQNVARRSYWKFTLPVSRSFERVGPVTLSLRSVNLKKKDFDLRIMAADFQIEHLHLREPVWIILSDPSRRVELVATRIDKNHVQGYLNEITYPKSELATSQVQRRPSGGS